MDKIEKYLCKNSYQSLLDCLQNGQKTTAEIRDCTNLEDTRQVKYRCRRLETFGIVEISEPRQDEHGRSLPLQVELTAEGEKIVSRYEWESREATAQTMEEKVEKLGHRVERLENSNDEVWEAVVELREEVFE